MCFGVRSSIDCRCERFAIWFGQKPGPSASRRVPRPWVGKGGKTLGKDGRRAHEVTLGRGGRRSGVRRALFSSCSCSCTRGGVASLVQFRGRDSSFVRPWGRGIRTKTNEADSFVGLPNFGLTRSKSQPTWAGAISQMPTVLSITATCPPSDCAARRIAGEPRTRKIDGSPDVARGGPSLWEESTLARLSLGGDMGHKGKLGACAFLGRCGWLGQNQRPASNQWLANRLERTDRRTAAAARIAPCPETCPESDS